jgi:integrase
MPEADSAPILADLVTRYRRMIPPESGQKPKLVDYLLKAPGSRYYSRRTEQSCGHWAKQATCHTFQRSLATHLFEGGDDIRTVKEPLGRNDVKTTMICTQVLNRGPAGVRSPVGGL